MMNMAYSVVIIGASQAGLVMGYYLQSAGIKYVILGKEQRIGDVWRQRYDSLTLFTPRWMNELPGRIARRQLDANGYANKDEIADELEAYAADYLLNVKLNTEVIGMTRTAGKIIVETQQEMFMASCVVVATGPFQQPYIPSFADQFSSAVWQTHTAHYKNKEQLQTGNVLIVGCGNSGAQIAAELAEHRQVHLSASEAITFFPQEVLGKSIFWWFDKLGLYQVNVNTKLGKRISQRKDPVIGKSLQTLIHSRKISRHPRTVQASGDIVTFNDGTELKVSNVIWATGFAADYSWVHVPDALDDKGKPNHERGISRAAGIYYLGLPWQYNRGSALLGGVAADAEYVLLHIVAKLSR